MMLAEATAVNFGWRGRDVFKFSRRRRYRAIPRKKAGLWRARLKVLASEADTITFQEGLLSFRATGGGGQMRNAFSQREDSMIPAGGLQQAVEPHVSHAQN
jgi:hypothetical protein